MEFVLLRVIAAGAGAALGARQASANKVVEQVSGNGDVLIDEFGSFRGRQTSASMDLVEEELSLPDLSLLALAACSEDNLIGQLVSRPSAFAHPDEESLRNCSRQDGLGVGLWKRGAKAPRCDGSIPPSEDERSSFWSGELIMGEEGKPHLVLDIHEEPVPHGHGYRARRGGEDRRLHEPGLHLLDHAVDAFSVLLDEAQELQNPHDAAIAAVVLVSHVLERDVTR